MLANLAQTISGWASRGRKRPPDAVAANESPHEEPIARVSATPKPEGKEPEADPHEPDPDEADPGEDDPLEGIGSEMRRGLEKAIEGLRVLCPGTGEDSDTLDLLNSVRRSASSNVRQPPAAAQAVLSFCQRREYSLLDLTQLIERDPSLSASLLRHANSAWYATPGAQPVLGVRAAVDRVGTNGVHAAVMSRILEGALSRPGPSFEGAARMVWDHMVRTAPIAGRLATPFGVDSQTAFSLALLHDVGKLVLFHHISDLRKTRRREIRISEDSLRLILGSLHQPLGGLAVLEWGLDKRAAHVVANHHRCPKPVPEDLLTEVVFLAERIDVAEQRGETLDIELLWDEAALTGPRDPVRELVEAGIEGES